MEGYSFIGDMENAARIKEYVEKVYGWSFVDHSLERMTYLDTSIQYAFKFGNI